MPALDRRHNAVVQALIKDGWTITDNPLRPTLGEHSILVDVGAERVVGAEKGQSALLLRSKPSLDHNLLPTFSRL